MSLDINLTNVQSKPIVVSANQTAENDRVYHVVANATFTDPTGVNGKGYEVFVRNGTATINSVAYTEGTTILRLFHSGAWVSYLGGGSQNLQQVTDIGNDTTNGIITTNAFVAFDDISSPDNYSVLSPNYLELGTNSTGEQLFLFGNNIQFVRGNGAIAGTFKATNVTSPNNVTLEFPNKPTGSYTIATTADIPDTSDFVAKSDFTSHSILAKQSGASDPVAVSIGNNEILGRKSGGGSNIEGLSVSEVKSLLNYTASDVGAVATNSVITGATKTKITYDAKGLVTSGTDATPSDFGMFLYKQPVRSANVTGTSETIVNSVDVGNGKFSSDDVMNIDSAFVKTGTANTYTFRYYLSTVNNDITVTNAILVAQGLGIASAVYIPNFPRFLTIHAGNVNGFPATLVLTLPVATSTARLNIVRNFASDMFLITTIQNTSGSDTTFLQSQIIKNF